MTVGDLLLKRPIEVEDLNHIVKHCPKPSLTPLGAIVYLKKACKGRSFTQEDMRLIIDGVIDHHSSWQWNKVPSIDTLVRSGNSDNYPLLYNITQSPECGNLPDQYNSVPRQPKVFTLYMSRRL